VIITLPGLVIIAGSIARQAVSLVHLPKGTEVLQTYYRNKGAGAE
jgi:hypothetical protein